MTAQEALRQISQRIQEFCDPEEIILFGSYARGSATPDSDLDLLVVLDDATDRRATRVGMYNALRGIPFPKDLVVAERGEIESHRCSDIVNSAIAEGKSVYRRGGYIG